MQYHGPQRNKQLFLCQHLKIIFLAATSYACKRIEMIMIIPKFKHIQDGRDSKVMNNKECLTNDSCCTIYFDNSFNIKLSKKLVMHEISNHIDVIFYLLSDLIKDGVINWVTTAQRRNLLTL